MCRLSTAKTDKGFKAGTLTENHAKWYDIHANQEVLSWLKDGAKIPFATEPDCFHLPNQKLSFTQGEFVASELNNLVKAGAIERCNSNTPPKCISPLGCVPKKGGETEINHRHEKNKLSCDRPKIPVRGYSNGHEYDSKRRSIDNAGYLQWVSPYPNSRARSGQIGNFFSEGAITAGKLHLLGYQ